MTTEGRLPRPIGICPACQGALQHIGQMMVHRPSALAGTIVVMPPGAGGPDTLVPVDAYRCHNCGRLELYDHDFVLPSGP